MSPSQRDHLRVGISLAGRSHDDGLPIIQSVVSWWQGLRSHELTLSLRGAAAARRGGRDWRAAEGRAGACGRAGAARDRLPPPR